VDVVGPQPGVIQQAGAQVGEVSLRVPFGRYALVHLNHVDPFPRNPLIGKSPQHSPGAASPLTATMKRPRTVAASRAFSAMTRLPCERPHRHHQALASSWRKYPRFCGTLKFLTVNRG